MHYAMRLMMLNLFFIMSGNVLAENADKKPQDEKKQEVKKNEATKTKQEDSKATKVADKKESDSKDEKEAKKEAKMPVDTVDLDEPQGNWLFKRIWFEKAQTLFEETRTAVDKVFDARMGFFVKRTDMDKTVFDPFYMEVGFGRGELEEILSYLIKLVEEQREKDGTLNEEERDFLATLVKEKETLKQLQNDIEGISKIDNAIDEGLAKMLEQINLCRNYEKQSWQSFKDIAKELNDKKAKALFYAMVTYKDNIDAIQNYIQKEFSDYFEKLMKLAKEQTDRVKSTLKGLKEKGVDFKKQVNKMEEKARALEKQHLNQEEKEAVDKAVQKTEQEMGFFNRLKGWWNGLIGGVSSAWHSVVNSIKSLFGGGKKAELAETSQTPASPDHKTSSVPSQGNVVSPSAASAGAANGPLSTAGQMPLQTLPLSQGIQGVAH